MSRRSSLSLTRLARVALVTLVTLVASTSWLGCSVESVEPGTGTETDTLDQEQANQAYSSTSSALTGAQQAAAEVAIDGDRVTVTAPCSGGGTTSIDGQFGDGSDFTLDIDFESCTEAELTIDGNVDYAAQIDDDGGVSLTITGLLSYSGTFEATCELDVAITAGAGGSSVTGTICDQSLSVSGTPGL